MEDEVIILLLDKQYIRQLLTRHRPTLGQDNIKQTRRLNKTKAEVTGRT